MKKDALKGKNMLGVINITPNSFSDGGFHTDSHNLIETLSYFNQFKNLIWDLGFESTAPMNARVDLIDEKKRFDFFLDVLHENKIKLPEVISIDTYKLSMMSYVYEKIKSKSPKTTLIFNDVSGVVDSDLKDFFNQYSDLKYIYCFTKNVTRQNVQDHMKNYAPYEDIVLEMLESFLFVKKYLDLSPNRLLLDPCFGFSKSIEDNWTILDNFQRVLEIKSEMGLTEKMIVGISKKSFIHKLIQSDDPKNDSEFVHYKIISDLNSLSKDLIFRVHHPEIYIQKSK